MIAGAGELVLARLEAEVAGISSVSMVGQLFTEGTATERGRVRLTYRRVR